MSEEQAPPEEEVQEQEKPAEEEEAPEEEPKPDPELEKWKKRAIRREDQLTKAQEELAKLKGEKEKPAEEDPLQKANRRLVHASARTVLTAAGVTDKDAQATVLSMLNLSDIDVDDEDGPDEDEIEKRLTKLREALAPREVRRRPGNVSPKDRGAGSPVDADTARYRRIIG